MIFCERISKVEPSATLAITSRAKKMLSEGEDVIILAAGEPDFDTPELVKKAAREAIDSGETKYTPSGGSLSLKKAIMHKLKRDNTLDYRPDEIVVSCGAKHSLFNIMQVLCDDTAVVAIIPPYWVSYPEMVKLAGGKPKYVDTSGKFKASVEDIKATLTKDVKAFILNSPSNPAGIVYSREELEEIGKHCVKNDIIIISDEIYETIIYDDLKHVSIASISPEIKEISVTVNGVSKSHSMTGWRIGYMAGPGELAKKVTTLQSHSTSNPCSISQAAAECALSDELRDSAQHFRDKFLERRDLLFELLNEEPKLKPYKGQGSFYMFCDISATGLDSVTFAKKLLDEKKTAVIPGAAFGRDDFIRISFASDKNNLKTGAKRIRDWLNTL